MKLRWMTTCCALIYLCIFFGTSALATDTVDGLYLCGSIKEINTQEAFITVDVTSESCRGLHKFKLPPTMNGTSLIVDARKCFFIDNSSCKQKLVYTITTIEKE